MIPFDGKKNLAICAFYVIVALAVYHPALKIGFLADDYIWLKESLHFTDLNFLDANIFRFGGGRPGALLIFALLANVFALNPATFHLVIIIFHALNSVLVYFLLRDFHVNFPIRFAAGLFFLIHFSHEEAIFWIAALSTVFCLFFSLAAVLMYNRLLVRKTMLFTVATIFCLSLAVLTRQEGVVVPLVLSLISYSRPRASNGSLSKFIQVVKENIVYFVPTFIYLCYSLAIVINSPTGYKFTLNPVVWVQNLVYLVVNHLIPLRLFFDLIGYEKQAIVLNSVATIARSLPVIAGALTVISLLLYVTVKSWSRIPVFAKFAGSVTIVGFLPYLTLDGTGQRFLYFSLVGGAMLFAFVIHEVSKSISKQRSGLLYLSLLLCVSVLSVATIQVRSKPWIQASQMAQEILEKTAYIHQSVPPDKDVYITNLPARLNGAYIFHQGFEEALALYLPESSRRIHHIRAPNLSTEIQKGLWFKYEEGRFALVKALP